MRTRGRITDELRAEIVAFAREHTDGEAAFLFGVSTRSVVRYRHAAGVASGYQPQERTAGCGTPSGWQRCPGDPAGRWEHCDTCRAWNTAKAAARAAKAAS